jgi:hypothetical protein
MQRRTTLFISAVGALMLVFAAFGGSALAKDRNGDRIPDRWEKRFNLSLKVNQADNDQDRDRVDNLNEFQEGTNPRKADTDNDGRRDGREDEDRDGLDNAGEDETANLPNDPDTDDNGVRDGDENAGTVASFDGGTLVINLAGGGQISGAVTSATEIKCETEDEHEMDNRGPGPNSGPGNATASSHGSDDGPGDDNGGRGEVENEIEHGDADNVCTTADLTVGAIVHEAELAGTTFHEVELLK